MRVKKALIPLLLIVLVFVGCTNFNKASYQAMGTMQTSYEVAMKSAADLHRRGLISDEGKQTIITEGREYVAAHNSAIDKFQDYLRAETADEQANKKQQYITASRVLIDYYSGLLNVLGRHGIYGEPVEPWF